MTVRFLALYETPADPAAFDRHYRDVHIPLGSRLPGLRRYTVGWDAAAVRGGTPYFLVAELESRRTTRRTAPTPSGLGELTQHPRHEKKVDHIEDRGG
jgi:uncharacterized protein (TIGR02118 family)